MPFAVALAAMCAAPATAVLGFGSFKLLQLTRRTSPEGVLAIPVTGNLFLSSLLEYLYGTMGLSVPPLLPGRFSLASVSIPATDLLIPVAAVGSVAAIWWWLYKTRSGRAIRAVADNASAASLMGIDPAQSLATAVGVAAFLAGLAGALRAPSQVLSPQMWVHPLVVSFAVVAVGGRNNLRVAVLGACLLAAAETVTAWFWNEAAAQFVALMILAVSLTYLPTGLLVGHVAWA